MPAFPNVAVLGPIQSSRNNEWFFIYTHATISHQLHKDSGPHQTEQDAELALEMMKKDYEDSGHVVYRARTQEDRHATQAFLREVTEYVTSETDDE
jgi:hypothetical protein